MCGDVRNVDVFKNTTSCRHFVGSIFQAFGQSHLHQFQNYLLSFSLFRLNCNQFDWAIATKLFSSNSNNNFKPVQRT